MSRTTSIVETTQASRYLQQLCKHWSHRFATEFDTTRGAVTLPSATLGLMADASRLTLDLEGPAAELPRLTEVVADHLRRFAFREELAIAWSPPAD